MLKLAEVHCMSWLGEHKKHKRGRSPHPSSARKIETMNQRSFSTLHDNTRALLFPNGARNIKTMNQSSLHTAARQYLLTCALPSPHCSRNIGSMNSCTRHTTHTPPGPFHMWPHCARNIVTRARLVLAAVCSPVLCLSVGNCQFSFGTHLRTKSKSAAHFDFCLFSRLCICRYQINVDKYYLPRESFTNYVASRGVRQMSTLLYNPFRVKVATKGEGDQKF